MTTAPDPNEAPAPAPRKPLKHARSWVIGAVLATLVGALWWALEPAQNAPQTPTPKEISAVPRVGTIEVHVLGPVDVPVEAARVHILGEAAANASAQTDSAGYARVVVPEGGVSLEIDAEGLGRGFASLEANAEKPVAVTIRLEKERLLEGTVKDDLGTPLHGAAVRVAAIDTPEMSAWESQSDASGRFRIKGLPRQALAIEVTHPGHDGVERTVLPGDPSALELALPRQGELLVVLRDAEGKPVKDAEALLTGPGLWPATSANTNERGEALFEALAGGRYSARARKDARIALPSVPMEVVSGTRSKIELSLSEGVRACGVLVDATTRAPIAAALVSVIDLTPSLPVRTGKSGEDGRFEIPGLWPGGVRLEISHEGYAPEALDRTLRAAPCETIALTGAATLSGLIVDEGGRPVSKALISVSTREGLPLNLDAPRGSGNLSPAGELGVTKGPVPRIPLGAPSTFAMGALAGESDANGAFRIPGLEPAPIVLNVAREGYAPTTLEVPELTPHGTKSDLRVVLPRAGRVEGTIRDLRGEGVPGVYVVARTPGGVEQSALSDERGAFSIRDVLGPLHVEAMPAGYAPRSCEVVVKAGELARCDLAIASALYQLRVRVLDPYGFGVEGALVSIDLPKSDRSVSQLSRADGTLVLRELPEPPYRVGVRLRDFLSVHDVDVSDVEHELRVTIEPAARVRGVVLDAIGRPVRGAFVSTDEGEASADSDADGAFELEGVRPGALVLWARHARAGQGQSHEIRARPRDTLEGVRIVLDGRYERERDAERTVAVSGARRASAPGRTHAPEKPVDLALGQQGPKVVVTAVSADSPAHKAGLRAGDIVLSIDRENVYSAAQVRGMLRDPPDSVAQLRVSRAGRVLGLRLHRPPLGRVRE